jgi:hypothetical protein
VAIDTACRVATARHLSSSRAWLELAADKSDEKSSRNTAAAAHVQYEELFIFVASRAGEAGCGGFASSIGHNPGLFDLA